MKANQIKRISFFITFYVLLAGLSSSFVCKQDEVNCTVLSAKYVVKAQEVANSIANGGQLNCDELKELYDEFYNLVRDGKDCPNIKAALEAAGFGSVDELITKYDLDLADVGC
jgi:hypothetical protein